MHNDIAMPEMTKSIKKLKKKSPGPDNITNEMLQHLGSSALGTLGHIQSELETRSSTLMLEGSYYDANIKERKYKVKSLEFLSNKPD